LSVNVKCFGLGRGSTPPTPQTRNGHSSPASIDGGLLAGVGKILFDLLWPRMFTCRRELL
jgi:hypothetical protein